MVDLQKPISPQVEQRLSSEIIIWLSSVRPDGRPHLVPVWYLWEKDSSSILIFSKPDNKVRNIRNNPAVMLALETQNQGDDVVMFEGTATLIDDPALSAAMPVYAKKYATLLQRMGSSAEKMAEEYSQTIRVTLKKVISWS